MPDKPNVLLICADHWGGMLTRPGGHPVVMTPTLSQLARLGTWYANTYSPAPSCIPARRSLMTGLSVRTHGDRIFKEREELPDVPTLAQTFRNAGYQASAVGKLHAYPQRDRIGFDEVILNEEGRHHLEGNADDWEMYLADKGYAGKEYAAGHSRATTTSPHGTCPTRRTRPTGPRGRCAARSDDATHESPLSGTCPTSPHTHRCGRCSRIWTCTVTSRSTLRPWASGPKTRTQSRGC